MFPRLTKPDGRAWVKEIKKLLLAIGALEGGQKNRSGSCRQFMLPCKTRIIPTPKSVTR